MAFCNVCGAEIPEGSGFCNVCGEAQRSLGAPITGEAASGSPGPAPKRSRNVWLALGAVIVAAVVAAGLIVNALVGGSSERVADAQEAVDAVAAVDAATTVGLTYDDYGRKLQDALAAVDRFSPSDSTGGEIKTYLVAAMALYLEAQEKWTEELESPGFQDAYIQRDWAAASEEVEEARALLADY